MTESSEPNYPSLLDRIKALVADWAFILGFLSLVSFVFSLVENVPDNARMAAFIFIFFLYDPMFTSFFGGTIGHMMMGIRVRKDSNYEKNIIFPLALIRFLVKALLGWISLLTVTGSLKRKAIHDFLAGSIVVFK